MMTVRDNAVNFLLRCSKSGLAHSHNELTGKWVKPYPEVTGYLLSFFSTYVDRTRVEQHMQKMASRLIRKQEPCGGWKSFEGNGILFFDTVQILKGLYDSGYWKTDYKVKMALIRGFDFLENLTTLDGLVFPVYFSHLNAMSSKSNSWSDGFSGINTKVLELLVSDGVENLYPEAASLRNRISEWSLTVPQIEFTHPGAYQLEGLLAAGENRLVRQRLQDIFLPTLRPNGFIPYHNSLDFAYTSGSAQIGILLAKTGFIGEAKAIQRFLLQLISSSSSGGLVQYADSVGNQVTEIHAEANSWGTKYFLELNDVLAK